MWLLSSTLRRTYPCFPKSRGRYQVRIFMCSPWRWAHASRFCGHLPPSALAVPAAGVRHEPESLCRSGFPYLGYRTSDHQCYPHPSRRSGSPVERCSAFIKLRSTTNFVKIIVHMLFCVTASGLHTCGSPHPRILSHTSCSTWLSTLLLVTDYRVLRNLRLCRVDPPARGFGIKAGLHPGSFCSSFTTAVNMLPWIGHNHIDERPG